MPALIHPSPKEKKQIFGKVDTASTSQFLARTYIIATHKLLDINHNELHYETLIRDASTLKEFIASKFT